MPATPTTPKQAQSTRLLQPASRPQRPSPAAPPPKLPWWVNNAIGQKTLDTVAQYQRSEPNDTSTASTSSAPDPAIGQKGREDVRMVKTQRQRGRARQRVIRSNTPPSDPGLLQYWRPRRIRAHKEVAADVEDLKGDEPDSSGSEADVGLPMLGRRGPQSKSKVPLFRGKATPPVSTPEKGARKQLRLKRTAGVKRNAKTHRMQAPAGERSITRTDPMENSEAGENGTDSDATVKQGDFCGALIRASSPSMHESASDEESTHAELPASSSPDRSVRARARPPARLGQPWGGSASAAFPEFQTASSQHANLLAAALRSPPGSSILGSNPVVRDPPVAPRNMIGTKSPSKAMPPPPLPVKSIPDLLADRRVPRSVLLRNDTPENFYGHELLHEHCARRNDIVRWSAKGPELPADFK